jgi:Cellulase (glycosyl hydrolase family 5)
MMMIKSLLSFLLAATASATVSYGGVNIAGFDFGCDVWGNCNGGLDESMVTTGAGLTQMTHFVSKGLNAFRLPVRWQFLAGSGDPGTLDEDNWLMYDQLVQACAKAGSSMCIVDMCVPPSFRPFSSNPAQPQLRALEWRHRGPGRPNQRAVRGHVDVARGQVQQ